MSTRRPRRERAGENPKHGRAAAGREGTAPTAGGEKGATRGVKVLAGGVWMETQDGVQQLSRQQLEVLRWIYDPPGGPGWSGCRDHFYRAIFGMPSRNDRRWKKRPVTASERASMGRLLRRLEERGLLVRTERDSVYAAVNGTVAGKALVKELKSYGTWEWLLGGQKDGESPEKR